MVKRMYRICGLPNEPGAPGANSFIPFIHEEDRESYDRWFSQLLVGRDPGAAEFRIRRHDGQDCIVLADGEVFAGAHGGVVRIAGTLQDITERKAAAALKTTARAARLEREDWRNAVLEAEKAGTQWKADFVLHCFRPMRFRRVVVTILALASPDRQSGTPFGLLPLELLCETFGHAASFYAGKEEAGVDSELEITTCPLGCKCLVCRRTRNIIYSEGRFSPCCI